MDSELKPVMSIFTDKRSSLETIRNTINEYLKEENK